MNPEELYRKPNSTQVVDTQGNPQPFTGNLDSLPISNVISPDKLGTSQEVKLPEQPEPTPTTPAQIDYDSLFGLTAFEKQAQQQQETSTTDLMRSLGVLEGEAQDLQKERQAQGLEALYKQAQGTKSRILALDAEIQKDDIELAQKLRAEERRDTLLPFAQMGQAKIAGDAAIYRALKTAEKNVLISQQLAQQGEIALAEQFAQDAVDAKYAPYRQRAENAKTLLEAIKPIVTSAEAKLLKVQEMKVNQALKEIEKQEATEKTIQEIALEVAKNGGDPTKITNTTTVNEAIKEARGYLTDPIDKALKSAQLRLANLDIAQKDNEVALLKAQIERIDAGQELTFADLTEKQQDQVFKLRDAYNKESGDFITIRDAYNRISASAEDPSAAGDLALIFNYMKMLDPGSVVRESEFANAAEAASYANRVYGLGLKITTGQRLAPEQRDDFVNRAKKLFKAQQAQQEEKNENYTMLAQDANIPSKYIVRDTNPATNTEQEFYDNLYKGQVNMSLIPTEDGAEVVNIKNIFNNVLKQ